MYTLASTVGFTTLATVTISETIRYE
jgi:hypothetical protein